MRRTSMWLSLATLWLVIFITAPAQAQTSERSRHNNDSPTLCQKYGGLYKAVAKRHGSKAPGRNICRHGIRMKAGSRDASTREKARSIRTFRRWLAPPSPWAAPGDRISARPAYAGGRWAIPRYIVMCESGGDYRARNPSGAGGAYQIMPGTFHAYGGVGDPASASPAMQDAVAARIYAAQGAAPWVCG